MKYIIELDEGDSIKLIKDNVEEDVDLESLEVYMDQVKLGDLEEGDIIVAGYDSGMSWISIVNYVDDDEYFSFADFNYTGFNDGQSVSFTVASCSQDWVRYASDKEKQILFDALRDYSSRAWDGSEIVRWRAPIGQEYSYIDLDNPDYICDCEEIMDSLDSFRWKAGNYFPVGYIKKKLSFSDTFEEIRMLNSKNED